MGMWVGIWLGWVVGAAVMEKGWGLPEILVRGKPAEAAMGVALRVLGNEGASRFEFAAMSPVDGVDTWKVEGGSGEGGVGVAEVKISGNSGAVIAAGLNHYLKYYLNSSVSWSGSHISLPSTPLPLPTTPLLAKRGTKYFYALNTCTFSYSLAGYNVSAWESLLDLMAMQGVTLPLSLTGQEKVWRDLFLEMGLEEEEVQRWFTGSHYLAWFRMGNIRGWEGGLDDGFLDGQLELQQFIIRRQLELGMIPVLPAFAGHVPSALRRLYPSASITNSTQWAGFPVNYTEDALLEVTDPLFATIGNDFVRKYLAALNLSAAEVEDVGFSADLWNEMVPRTTNLSYLHSAGKALHLAVAGVVPKATIVVQSWMLHNSWWTSNRTKAFFTGFPNDSLLILDMNTDESPSWSQFDSYYGRPWIWCSLEEGGGRSGIYGNLSVIATTTVTDRRNTSMVGMGYTPESIGHNPIVVDLLAEMAWRTTPLSLSPSTPTSSSPSIFPPCTNSLDGWIEAFAERRYGGGGEKVKEAWRWLHVGGYHEIDSGVWSVLEFTPSLSAGVSRAMNATAFVNALRCLVEAVEVGEVEEELETVRFDLVDVARQVVSDVLVDTLALLVREFDRFQVNGQNSTPAVLPLIDRFNTGLDMLENLLETNEYFLLGTWLHDALRIPNTSTSTQRSARLRNAKTLVTLWGPDGVLQDYASHQHAGLVGSYYHSRWGLFFDALQSSLDTKSPFNQTVLDATLLKFSQSWTHSPTLFSENPQGNTLSAITPIMETLVDAPDDIRSAFTILNNTDYSGGDLLNPPTWSTDTDQLLLLCHTDPNCLGFNSNGYVKNFSSTPVPFQGSTFYLKKASK